MSHACWVGTSVKTDARIAAPARATSIQLLDGSGSPKPDRTAVTRLSFCRCPQLLSLPRLDPLPRPREPELEPELRETLPELLPELREPLPPLLEPRLDDRLEPPERPEACIPPPLDEELRPDRLDPPRELLLLLLS